MIKKIGLKNFQSHKDTEIELHEGVNTIIGTSDSGKSAIIRGLDLLINNKMGGDSFVSTWLRNSKGNLTGNAEVSLQTDEDTILRVKGKDNHYYLNGEELSAFGRSNVPEEVEQALNLNELNLQKQSDNFFLFGATSGEVVRRINSYVDLELIDKTLANADSELRSLRAEKKNLDKSAKEYQESIDGFGFLDDVNKLYQDAIKYDKAIEEAKVSYDTIKGILDAIENINSQLDKMGDIDGVVSGINTALELHRSIKLIVAEKVMLGTHRDNAISTKSKLMQIGNVDATSSKIEATRQLLSAQGKLSDTIDKTYRLVESYENVEKQYNKVKRIAEVVLPEVKSNEEDISLITTCLNNIRKTRREIRTVSGELKELEEKYHEVMPDTCPLCGK